MNNTDIDIEDVAMEVTKPKVLVAYHGDCIDGFTSAWVTYNALEKLGHEVKLLAMDYTDASIDNMFTELEVDEYFRLVVVDYSLKMPVLSKLQAVHPKVSVLILDHHKTAFEEYAPDMEITATSYHEAELYNTHVILDNDQSGASLCWKYFHDDYDISPLPKLVEYVKDHDLWRFDLGKDTKFINKYLMTRDKTIENWDIIHSQLEDYTGRKMAISMGRELQAKHDYKVDKVAEFAARIKLGGIEGLAVDCPRDLTSDVGHTLATRSGTFGAMFSIDIEKNQITWSLRSNGDFDVSAIAGAYGGGGHKNAAGFITCLYPLKPMNQVRNCF